ncbi:hypothetical protein [Natronorubrum sp. A-ect3]|uniref:hypothetical protein n=1 Tax=Natronorubrum sp. A-ect3 TaxID=3242698 RepID=UPI00359EB3B4
MSADASAPVTASSGADEYDELLDDLDAAIAEARRKVESGRVRDAENEKVRQGWIRVLAYTANVKRQVQNDSKLADLDERISALEEGE